MLRCPVSDVRGQLRVPQGTAGLRMILSEYAGA
jgi:hypothetical protein